MKREPATQRLARTSPWSWLWHEPLQHVDIFTNFVPAMDSDFGAGEEASIFKRGHCTEGVRWAADVGPFLVNLFF